jgi:hypothetical protein
VLFYDAVIGRVSKSLHNIRSPSDMDAARSIVSKLQIPKTSSKAWQIGTFIGIIVLMFCYFLTGRWYKYTYAEYRSQPASIQRLLAIKRKKLSDAIDPLYPNTNSVCSQLLGKQGFYSQIDVSKTAVVNWRPLTVRLAGYLGGIHTARDGVFDMTKGIQLALAQGARAFVFDIDYLDVAPCNPVVIHRDNSGYMRSLHTGKILEGMKALANMAFTTNYDPVMVIIYLRRIPKLASQQDSFFKGIAASLDPISGYHLGLNEQGNFHNCKSESVLFTSPITNYQKQFIVMTNYNTNTLPDTANPKDNLDFWTNARIWVDESGKSSVLGEVTASVPPGQIPYAQMGATTQLLNIGSADQPNYIQTSSNTFKIAISDLEVTLSNAQLHTLMNTLGIQCVPIDVIAAAAKKDHANTIKTTNKGPKTIKDLSNSMNDKDPLSFWAFAGWSHKLIVEGFQDAAPVPLASPIQGFIIPPAVVPKRPPASTNSNGGLVSIG